MALHKAVLLVLFGVAMPLGCGGAPDDRFRDDPLGQYLLAKEVTPEQIAGAEAEIGSMNAFRLEFLPRPGGGLKSPNHFPMFEYNDDFYRRYRFNSTFMSSGMYMYPESPNLNLFGLPGEPLRQYVRTYEQKGFRLHRIHKSFEPTPEILAHSTELFLEGIQDWESRYQELGRKHTVLNLVEPKKFNFDKPEWKYFYDRPGINYSYGMKSGLKGDVPSQDEFIDMGIRAGWPTHIESFAINLMERRVRLPKQGHEISIHVEYGETGEHDWVVASEILHAFLDAIGPLMEYEREIGSEPVFVDESTQQLREQSIIERQLNANR